MPKIFTQLVLLTFFLTAATGVMMRLVPFSTTIAHIPYDHLLHAHSHIALLGWTFIGAVLVFLWLIWNDLPTRSRKHGMIIVTVLFTVSIALFIAFLNQGYALYSIILSMLHIFVQYWTAIFMYRQVKQHHLSPIGRLFVNGSLIALIISSFGPFALGFIAANDLRDSYFFDMAVYFYLHFQYNGWLLLFLIGMFLMILHKKGVNLSTKNFKIGFWITFIALFPSYFSSVLWAELGSLVTILSSIGVIGQWIGILYILVAILNHWEGVILSTHKLTCLSLVISLILLLLKSTLELGLLSPAVAELVYDTRSIVVGYLHLTLLGFISLFLLSQMQMLNMIQANKQLVTTGFWLYFIGFGLNEGLLFLSGLLTWMKFPVITFYLEGLLLASVMLLIAISIIWFSIIKNKKAVL